MYEPYQILGAILFGALGLYLAVFYGSALIAYIYGSYLHDGDEEIWSLPSYIAGKESWLTWGDDCLFSAYCLSGAIFPMFYMLISMSLFEATRHTGMLVPYIIMGIASAWSVLYVLRLVIRLNKKLDKHTQDKNTHN